MIFLIISLLLFNTQIIEKNKIENVSSQQASQSLLNKYNFDKEGTRTIKLIPKLREISGITVVKGDRIFAHNDEEGTIFEIDHSSGKVLKTFSIGRSKILEDFEDIASAGSRLFLITSGGTLYKFSEGSDKGNVDYEKYSTGLTRSYDVEGMCYDQETNSLLIACKAYPGRGYENTKTVYSFSLDTYKLEKKPKFILNLDEIERRFGIKNVSPSAITKHLKSGSYFILSSHESAVIEVSKDGKILAAKKLHKKTHPQPEGIAVLSDNTLLISDEQKKGGTIGFYNAP